MCSVRGDAHPPEFFMSAVPSWHGMGKAIILQVNCQITDWWQGPDSATTQVCPGLVEGERPREPSAVVLRWYVMWRVLLVRLVRFARTLTLQICCFQGGCFCLFWRFAGTLTVHNFYVRCTGPVLGGPRWLLHGFDFFFDEGDLFFVEVVFGAEMQSLSLLQALSLSKCRSAAGHKISPNLLA